jgi:hypothetical protein
LLLDSSTKGHVFCSVVDCVCLGYI